MGDNDQINHQEPNMREEDGDHLAAPALPQPNLPKENLYGSVSILNRCETVDANHLFIYNLHTQGGLDQHDVGGTYSNETPELWFYYTTSVQPRCFLLLNLFVCHRKTGSFAIGVPSSSDYKFKDNVCALPSTLTWYNFRSAQKDESHYIKTFFITLEHFKPDADILTTNVVIPLQIRVNPPFTLDSDVLEAIKLQHNQENNCFTEEKPDLTIKSNSGKEYPVHKILLASHSSVLRELIKNNKLLCLDTNDTAIDLFLQYIYTGTIKDMDKHSVFELLETVHKFQLKPLLLLIDHLIERDLTVNNAVEMALVAKKYTLKSVKTKVFNYIKNNPDVMNSEGWKRLDDVELAKSVFEYVLTNKIV